MLYKRLQENLEIFQVGFLCSFWLRKYSFKYFVYLLLNEKNIYQTEAHELHYGEYVYMSYMLTDIWYTF